MAHSSFGDYNYSWPYHGRKSFKHFILELSEDPSYFLNKVAKEDYFYADKTEEKWKKEIIEDRHAGNLTKKIARDIWNVIDEIDFDSAETCQREICDSDIINEFYTEPWEDFIPVVGYDPDAIYFAKKVMPMFAEIIKKEIEESEVKQ